MTSESTPLIVITALSAVGAIIGGSLSNYVNHIISTKQSKLKNRQRFLERRLQVYSNLIYHLENLRLTGDALQKINPESHPKDIWAYKDKAFPEIVYAIDSEIKNKLYLLDYEILREWVNVKTLFHRPESTNHLTKLTGLLINQFNAIVKDYTELVGEGMKKLPYDLKI